MEKRFLIIGSVDYKYYKFNFILFVCVTVFVFCAIGLPSLLLWDYQPGAVLIMMLFSLLISAPFAIYYYVRMCALLRSSEKCILTRATLKNPRPHWREIYFDAHTDEGKVYETRAVFSQALMSERCFSDWNEKRVEIALDESVGYAIVLKKI